MTHGILTAVDQRLTRRGRTGIRPFLGWQGVIPANARRMATTAVDLLTRSLVDPQEIFARLDPEEMVKELEPPALDVRNRSSRRCSS